MMADSEFDVFSAWCRAHDLHWLATRDADGVEGLELEPDGRHAGSKRTRLIRRNGAFHLTDDHGNALASASALQPVLDALDGGVAEPSEALRSNRCVAKACLV